MSRKLRIAAFGFRSFPPRNGSAGADKFALELLPRLAARGHNVVAYNRAYPGEIVPEEHDHLGVLVVTRRTFRKQGIEALWHSAQVTWDILVRNRADIVHIQNGGNSPFAAVLRLFGKRTYLSEDGKEWERKKWSALAKLYLRATMKLTSFVHNEVIFDNVFTRDFFEARYRRKYAFVPFGADVAYDEGAESVLAEHGLKPGEYFLFVGRFIPDKGLHYLLPAFEGLSTDKKLVLVGGSPVETEYDRQIRSTTDERVKFLGYMYGSKVHALMKNCFAYVQPSDLEGLSPVILESSYLGAPIICSDIAMNKYILDEEGIYFERGNIEDLKRVLQMAVSDPEFLKSRAVRQSRLVQERYSWTKIVDQHIEIFTENTIGSESQ